MTFQNQIVLVTGGSSGIGLATARAFAQKGAHVWLVARNGARLEQARAQVQAACACAHQTCGVSAADVSDAEQAAAAVAEVSARVGVPDIVVNSHGMMDVNYFGALHIIRAVTPGMMARGSGHIVNVASGAALLPAYGYTAYSASKYALRGISDVLRLELKPYNIRVSVVYPPDTDTPQLAWEEAYKPTETKAVYGGVVLSPDFVANAILHGIQHKRYSITPGLEMAAFAKLANLLGDWQFSVLDGLLSRARRKHHEQHPRQP
jgi:3-dehydrosphinganine reductase